MNRSVMLTIFLVFSSAAMFDFYGAEPGKTSAPKQDSAEKDYKSELPRIAPKEPREALKTFKLQPGFRIELVAAEPLLRDPVAMDFDENGRMFVVELPEYNQYENKAFKGHGVVRLLEDIDDDGQYEKSTVYVDKLKYPTAVACWDGGVFIGAAPDLLYCKDTNGDGRADVRTVVYTGFGTDRAGEAHLNSFRWTFDNRFHVSTGLDGGNITAVGQKNAKPLSVKTRQFLFDPRSRKMDWTSGGGQHGLSLDDWGRAFVCSNSNPMQMLMYDGRYLARNPYLQAPAAATNIAPGGKYTKIFRISRIEPWRIVRTRLRAKGIVKGPVEGGGTPAGYFSAATGVTVYRGDAWPEQYSGDVLVGEVASNMIFRAKLQQKGLGVIALRADADAEFLASTDNWFRPVQLAHGPDGTIYILDMYRELIEGAAFLPPQVLKHMNVAGGVNRGRIYRIVPDKFKRPKSPKLGARTTAELVTLLEHTNGWHRDSASRLLYERQDKSIVPLLRKIAAESSLPQGRMHALYALDGLGSLAAEELLIALGDSHSRVREHAVRLSEKLADKSPAVRAKLYELGQDADLRVRYQLAFSLGAFTGEARNTQLAKLILQDGANSWVRLAVLSSLSEGAGDVFSRVIANAKFRKTAQGRSFLSTLASHIGGAGRRNDIAAVVKSFDQLPDGEKSLTQAIVRSLVAKQSGAASKRLSDAAGGKAGSILAEMVVDARRAAPDTKRKLSERVEAIRTLGMSDFGDSAKLFDELLQLNQPQPVQSAVLDTLAKFQSPQVASLLLDAWPGLSPTLRSRAAETLFSRSAWITALLDALETKRVSRGEISAARVKLLASHPDKKIRTRAAKLFAGTGLARRKEVVADYRKSLTLTGDRARGKMHFKKVCSACHKLEGVGTVVGEDLAAIRNRGN